MFIRGVWMEIGEPEHLWSVIFELYYNWKCATTETVDNYLSNGGSVTKKTKRTKQEAITIMYSKLSETEKLDVIKQLGG